MNTAVRSVITKALAVVILSGCVSTGPLFDDKFDLDTPENRPNPSPLGPPPNDVISILGADPTNLIVIGIGAIDICTIGRSLLYKFQPEVAQANFIGSVYKRPTAPKYFATWSGRAGRFDSSTPTLRFTFGNLNIGRGILEIKNGEFITSGDVLGDVIVDAVHRISMVIDTAEGTYTVRVEQDYVSGISRTAPSPICPEASLRGLRPRIILRSDPKPLSGRGIYPDDDTMMLGMTHDNTLSSHPATYVIDDVLIGEEEAAMP